MPCSHCQRIAHQHGFLIINVSKRCQPNITQPTPRKAKNLCGQHSGGELQSPEGSSSQLGQTQLSLLRTNGWETTEMLVLSIIIPLLLMSEQKNTQGVNLIS